MPIAFTQRDVQHQAELIFVVKGRLLDLHTVVEHRVIDEIARAVAAEVEPRLRRGGRYVLGAEPSELVTELD